jgi:hypothetical protein
VIVSAGESESHGQSAGCGALVPCPYMVGHPLRSCDPMADRFAIRRNQPGSLPVGESLDPISRRAEGVFF